MMARSFGLTDVGRRRENNQDHLLVAPGPGLYAIADGMGGHAAGEVASRIAIDAIGDGIADHGDARSRPATAEDAVELLGRALKEGNLRICDSVLVREEWRGMGTTIVAMLVLGDEAVIAHVGDSRAYLLRGDRLGRLTEDHSWVYQQVRAGLLSEEEAHRHPMRNIVTRALGNRPEIDVDFKIQTVLAGDTFLLCSDGLNSMLADDEIRDTLAEHRRDPESACRALVDGANARGGEDNVTVIVVAAGPDGPDT